MKSTQRQAALAAALFALVAGAPAVAVGQPARGPEQRGGPAGPDTKGILVATFRSDDRKLGVDAADAVRKRLQDEYSMKQLEVKTKRAIDGTLEQSGYKPDSALSASDLLELAKQLRADYVLDAAASRVAEGVKIEPRLLLRRGQTTLVQPFAAVMSKDPGTAAREVHKQVAEALKAMPMYTNCENNLRAQKFDAAIADGRAVLVAYPASTLGRLCVLTGFKESKAAPDSMIRVAKEILVNDPGSIIALSNLADAYNAKGDKESAIETMVKLWRADPSNAPLAEGIIQALGQSGAPDRALPIIDEMLKDNPGDPKMLSTKWKLLLGAKRYKDAISVGEEWAKADSGAATLDFFNRMAAAASLDSNTQLSMQYMARGVQKYPKDADLQLQYANALYRAGQLQQALERAQAVIAIDPKRTSAYTILLVAQTQTNQLDSAMATAQKAITAGVDKQTVADVLVGVLAPAMKKAQDTKTREDWTTAMKTAQAVDAIAPSATTKYYIGASSFQIASDFATELQATVADIQKSARNATPANKAKACEQAKTVEDMLATTSINMPAGAKVDAATAGQILGAVQQYGDYIGNVKKAFCPKS